MKTYTASSFPTAVKRLSGAQSEIADMVCYAISQAKKHGNLNPLNKIVEATTLSNGKLSKLGTQIKGYTKAQVTGLSAPDKDTNSWTFGKKGKAGVELKEGAFSVSFLEWQAVTKPKAAPKLPTDKAITKRIDGIAKALEGGIASASMVDLQALYNSANALLSSVANVIATSDLSSPDLEAVATLASVKATGKEKAAESVSTDRSHGEVIQGELIAVGN